MRLNLPADNIFGATEGRGPTPEGFPYQSVANGWVVLLAPLPPGTHRIRTTPIGVFPIGGNPPPRGGPRQHHHDQRQARPLTDLPAHISHDSRLAFWSGVGAAGAQLLDHRDTDRDPLGDRTELVASKLFGARPHARLSLDRIGEERVHGVGGAEGLKAGQIASETLALVSVARLAGVPPVALGQPGLVELRGSDSVLAAATQARAVRGRLPAQALAALHEAPRSSSHVSQEVDDLRDRRPEDE